MIKMFWLRRSAAIVCILSLCQGCGVLLYDKTVRTYVDSEDVLHRRRDTVQVASHSLFVAEADIRDTQLMGRLRWAAQCRDIEIQTIEKQVIKEDTYVNNNGEPVSISSFGGLELGLGVAMPLILPIVVLFDCDEETEDCSDEEDDSDTDLVPLFAAGAVIGGALILSGLVDLIASAGTGVKETWIESEERIKDDIHPILPCDDLRIEAQPASLKINTSTLAVAVQEGGHFTVSLIPSASAIVETPEAPWILTLSNGESAVIPYDTSPERYRLIGRLESYAAFTSTTSTP